MKSKITIGITGCGKFDNYRRWIEQESGAEVIRLDKGVTAADVERCDGVVLSGGEDVHPRYYRKTEYLELCQEIDEERDAMEWKVLETTEKKQIPVLGICRGLQVANVFLGGTLIPDIPTFGKFDHAKTEAADRYHIVHVDENSMLREVVGASSGTVNSAHHQSADRIGKGLVANAISVDGIVEGLERRRGATGGFMLLVQWHPERMNEPESPFSKNIRKTFLAVARSAK